MMLSVMPLVRYSVAGSAPAFTKGKTASDFPLGRGRLTAAPLGTVEPSSARSAIPTSAADSKRFEARR
jgi:hypothetical protein